MDIRSGLSRSTVDVLGLGESITLHEGNNITVGVNDIFRIKPVNVLLCVDFKMAFTPERLSIIENSRGCEFYSHLDEWRTQPNFHKIKLQSNRPKTIANLDCDELPKSVFSPFVAVALAYKLYKPELIRVYGVDMTNHIHLTSQKKLIQENWKALKVALAMKDCLLQVNGNGILSKV